MTCYRFPYAFKPPLSRRESQEEGPGEKEGKTPRRTRQPERSGQMAARTTADRRETSSGTTANAQGSLPNHYARRVRAGTHRAAHEAITARTPTEARKWHLLPFAGPRTLAGELRPVPAGLAGGGARPRRDKPGVVVDGG